MPSSIFTATVIIVGVLLALVFHSLHLPPSALGHPILFALGLVALVAAVVVLIYEARHS